MPNRSSIPEKTKRELRQESDFGCCVCGNPIIQYHHIIPWEVEEHFRANDMMCLCPNHHDEATKGALTAKEQKEYKATPYNIKRKYVNGFLKINFNVPFIKVGSCNFVGDGDFISVDKLCLLKIGIDSGHLVLSIKLYDKNDKLKVMIDKNEWVSGNPMPWDIEASYQFLKIWHKKRDIGLEINAKEFPITLLAKFIYKRQKFEINNKGIYFDGVIQNNSFHNISFVGINFVADTYNKVLSLKPDPRFGKGAFVVGKSIEECLAEWKKLNDNIT